MIVKRQCNHLNGIWIIFDQGGGRMEAGMIMIGSKLIHVEDGL